MFRIGDKVEILPPSVGQTYTPQAQEHVGKVVVVVGGPYPPQDDRHLSGNYWAVDLPDYSHQFHQSRLRLVPPDDWMKTSWENCLWRPSKSTKTV